MSYIAKEQSEYGGNPIELYVFTYGLIVWRFTSSLSAITYDGNTYSPMYLERAAVTIARELSKNAFKVQTEETNPVALLFLAGSPDKVVQISILRGHRDDGDFQQLTSGRVMSCEWSSTGKASFTIEQDATAMRTTGLRRFYGTLCGHILYGDDCKAAKNPIPGTCTALSGLVATVSSANSHADGYFVGGLIVANNETRMIVAHVGQLVTLNAAIISLSSGDSVILYAGCDHSIDACNTIHSNKLNFGGQPFIPDKEIFIGKAVK
jgi:uncharacterized phage protein (TIGR02218 family)